MKTFLRRSILWLTLATLAGMLPSGCQVAESKGKVTFSIAADTSWLRYDRVLCILRDDKQSDTLFSGKLAGLDTLSRLPGQGYDGGRVWIIIQGYKAGLLSYEERRDYDGSTQKNLSVEVTLDLSQPPASAGALDIRPDNVRLFAGGKSMTMEIHPDAWKGKPLAWTTGDPGVATVSQDGVLSPVGPGVTYVRAASGDSVHDASSVTVVKDPPVLDVGAPDTTVAAGTNLSFQVKVTQEYGDVAEFAWDLDGDGNYEGSLPGAAGQILFTTPSRAFPTMGDFQIHFRASDGEGNITTASKRVHVKATAPKIDSLIAVPASVRVGDTVSFTASASGGGASLLGFAWDFEGDGKIDSAGNLQGLVATLRIRNRYLSPGSFKAALRITDAIGDTIMATVPVTVKQDRPTADAGPDVAVQEDQQVRLQGRAGDSLGHVVLREWKIGTGNFAPAPDSGTATFKAPDTAATIPCVFRVTNDLAVTAEDTVKITVSPSTLATLSSLKLSAGQLVPAFAPETLSYSANVYYPNDFITLTAATSSPRATLYLNGVVWDSGHESFPFKMEVGGNNVIAVDVIAEDAVTKRSYKISVTRAVKPNTSLTKLLASAGTLTPAFSPTVTSYTDSMPAGATSVTFTPTAADPTSIITVNGGVVPSGGTSAPIPKGTAVDFTTIRVTAQDSVTQTTYYVLYVW